MQIRNKECRHELLADGHACNHNVFFRNVLVHAAAASRDGFDLIDHVHTFNHFCEHAVAPTLQAFAGEVQEVVISHVDEELRRRGVRRLVRAIASVPRVFFRPLLASFLIASFVAFCFIPGSKPPPGS